MWNLCVFLAVFMCTSFTVLLCSIVGPYVNQESVRGALDGGEGGVATVLSIVSQPTCAAWE